MLNFLILLILMFSLVTALFNGQIDFLCNQLLDSPQKAVELTVTVGCSICLWSGVIEGARQSGLLRFLSKFFSPILSLLFPGIKKDSPAAQAVCLNLAANLLGLGAAAAPAGICAVSQFQRACLDPSVACDNSILLILLNTASLQLIPTTAAMLRPWRFCLLYGWHPFFRSPPVFLPQKEWLILLTQNSLLIPES